MDNKVIGVVGATASGKTSLAIKIAQKYDGEIISADSMQIYKGMNIATAKPDKEEMCGIPHHIMDFLLPTETFSVSQYVEMAKNKIDDILSRGKIPIVCGGTGLYVRSLVENIQFSPEQADENLRNALNERYEKEGGEVLLKELAEFDEDIAKTLHPSNNKRIIRAIEIYKTTGVTMSEHIRKSKSIPSPYEWTVLGIAYKDRQKLYDRINARVDIMLETGLLEETREFYKQNIGKTAVGAIGYKELKPYLDGEMTLEQAVENLKQVTRNYAKRQMTWFKKDEYIKWIYADECGDVFGEAEKILAFRFTK